MKKLILLMGGITLLLSLDSCRQKSTDDGTLIDRENGYSEEELDNRGGQAQSQDRGVR